jgi:NTP pyrophosphatase (non-canonical NTP hydrolase)
MEVKDLKEIVKNFIDKREWRQFQTSKDLAEDISIEANELLELFLWKDGKQMDNNLKNDSELLKKVKNETADVLFGCLAMADHLDFDLEEAFLSKIDQLNKRYSVEDVKGKSVKINEEEWLKEHREEL